MVEAIREKSPLNQSRKVKLKQIEGQFESLSPYNTNEGDIIVRDAQEILIPKE